jgi:hypothetical protein
MAGERQKAARAERFKAKALDALDVGKGWTGPGKGAALIDVATDEAVATVGERAKLHAAVEARDNAAIQAAQRELAAKRAAASEEQWEATLARRLEEESDALTESELHAAEEIAAATAGPLYVGGSEELYDEGDFEAEEGEGE